MKKPRGKKKKGMTLIEIMVVIFIIGIVGTVIGYSTQGSLEKGKAFKSENGSRRVYDLLSLELAKGDVTLEMIAEDPRSVLKQAGVVSEVDKLLVDGWGHPYEILIDEEDDEIKVISKKYLTYLQKKMKAEEITKKVPWMIVQNAYLSGE